MYACQHVGWEVYKCMDNEVAILFRSPRMLYKWIDVCGRVPVVGIERNCSRNLYSARGSLLAPHAGSRIVGYVRES